MACKTLKKIWISYHNIKITMQETLVTTPTHLLSEKDVNNRIR